MHTRHTTNAVPATGLPKNPNELPTVSCPKTPNAVLATGFPKNPNGVPSYSPGLPESARATLGLLMKENPTLKGLHNPHALA